MNNIKETTSFSVVTTELYMGATQYYLQTTAIRKRTHRVIVLQYILAHNRVLNKMGVRLSQKELSVQSSLSGPTTEELQELEVPTLAWYHMIVEQRKSEFDAWDSLGTNFNNLLKNWGDIPVIATLEHRIACWLTRNEIQFNSIMGPTLNYLAGEFFSIPILINQRKSLNWEGIGQVSHQVTLTGELKYNPEPRKIGFLCDKRWHTLDNFCQLLENALAHKEEYSLPDQNL